MRRPIILTAVIPVALVLASCGGSSSSSSNNSAPPASSPPATTATQAGETAGAGNKLTLAADSSGQLKYDQKAMVASAGNVTIDFTNSSPIPHDVAIQSGTSGPIIGKTPIFNGGSKTLNVKLKAGTYTFYCTVPGHRQAGMVGTLTVH